MGLKALPDHRYYRIERLQDCPQIFISVEFFRTPPDNVVIEWTDGNVSGGLCGVVRDGNPCHEHCMKGVIVKLLEPHRIWKLTGEATRRTVGDATELLGYEAVWPD